MRYFAFVREKPSLLDRSLDGMSSLSLFVMFSTYDWDN